MYVVKERGGLFHCRNRLWCRLSFREAYACCENRIGRHRYLVNKGGIEAGEITFFLAHFMEYMAGARLCEEVFYSRRSIAFENVAGNFIRNRHRHPPRSRQNIHRRDHSGHPRPMRS